MEDVEKGVEEDEEGVLLYYKFVSIPDPHTLGLWFQSLCSSLTLVGRVRVAPDGVNVTIGGTLTSLHKHIDAVKSHPWLGGCDFKLASAHNTAISRSTIAPEVGFSSLAVRVVKELVTLGVHPTKNPSISDAGVHLSAMEFHRNILEGGEHMYTSIPKCADWMEQNALTAFAKESTMADTTAHSDGNLLQDLLDKMEKVMDNQELVILDVRNIYETRIGRFVPPKGVDFLDPQIRQYSDLPRWIDSNAEKLQDKNILMYCTGGVRCEMASAYLKEKGKGFENVFQLSGGIQRYLEAFPDGGFFKGKNFVFDHRVAVPSSCPEVLGTCMNCGLSYDDYSSRIRCIHCRMLVLVCTNCQAGNAQPRVHLCELCRASKPPRASKDDVNHPLSLNLSGHCWSEAAEEKRPSVKVSSAHMECGASSRKELDVLINGPAVRLKLRILCLHGFRQSASSLKGRLAAFTKKLKGMADFVFVDAPHEVPLIFRNANHEHEAYQNRPESRVPPKKYAWLITPEMMLRHMDSQAGLDSVGATLTQMGFDKDQYKRQTLGWLASLSKLEEVFSDLGPFDGVLGFSQGAAIAASLCLHLEWTIQANSSIKFRFVILCSGFLSPAKETQDLMSSISLPVNCPSLHIYADNAGHDRQIVNDDSVQLRGLFNPESAVILTHSLGHIVPSQKEKMECVKNYLSQFI